MQWHPINSSIEKINFNKDFFPFSIFKIKLKSSDNIHPTDMYNSSLSNVDNSSKIWIHRPDKSLINPARCVDMDCDGLKKVIISDRDGSFFGTIGTATSQSEWQWNGDPARGLGDYRIPKEALADSNGRLKNMSDVYKYTGSIRDETLCTYKTDWQAYHCNNMTMKSLVIESMDSDTETRRISPVAIFSDDYKYVDLLNGPVGNEF